jgi:hypothetical protein
VIHVRILIGQRASRRSWQRLHAYAPAAEPRTLCGAAATEHDVTRQDVRGMQRDPGWSSKLCPQCLAKLEREG